MNACLCIGIVAVRIDTVEHLRTLFCNVLAPAGPTIQQCTSPASTAGGTIDILGRHFGTRPKVSWADPAGSDTTLTVLSADSNKVSVAVPPGVGAGSELHIIREDGQLSNTVPLKYPAPHVDSIEFGDLRADDRCEIIADVGRKGRCWHIKIPPRGQIPLRLQGANMGEPGAGYLAATFGDQRVPRDNIMTSAPHTELTVTIPPGELTPHCLLCVVHGMQLLR